MRVLFFGTSTFSVPSLEALAQRGHDILRCVTQPDRPQGRGQRPAPSPVKIAAQRLGLTVQEPEDLRAMLPEWRGLAPEVGIVIAYGRILRRELLDLPTHQMFGVHPSLLPKYRGANPIAWPILQGETTTGVTIFRLNERMDAGEIALQREVAIRPEETAEELSVRLASDGAALLAEALNQLAAGRLRLQPQDESQATFTQRFSKTDGVIDWREPAEKIQRLIRATTPWPGAQTAWRGEPMKLAAVRLDGAREAATRQPGEVIAVDQDGLTVATGQGALVIEALQPAGKRRMLVREFLAGRRIAVGDRFGDVGPDRSVGDAEPPA